ncbi:hypothetical protein AA983_07590 [Dermacoccus sp. PE3]|nr:hypothetical protein AA983_07590 [Dermacoccus sp. PE3]
MNTTEPAPSKTSQAGTLILTVWPDSPVGEHQRHAYRIENTTTGQVLGGRDLFTGAGAQVAPERLMRDLATFLSTAGDARQYAMDNPGSIPKHERLFPEWIAEAARQNADALTLLAEGEQLANQRRPRAQTTPHQNWFERSEHGAARPTQGPSL